jgi:hypothetical protein
VDTKVNMRSENTAHASLGETIASLCVEFRNVRDELESTLRENQALKRELHGWRRRHRSLTTTDVGRLRRHVAYYCHPDRGGDAGLMSTLNALFDELERDRTPAVECAEGGDA